MSAKREPPAVRLGGSGLGVDVVSMVLSGEGVKVVELGDPLTGPGAAVSLLVDPAAGDWATARAQGEPIVLVTEDEPTDRLVVDAVLRGADAVVAPADIASTIIEVLEVVGQGGALLEPRHVRALAEVARAAEARGDVTLTPRESEILISIAGGRSVKQTARELRISVKTVENLQSRLFRKLGARNRAQAVARGHVLGLLGESP